MKLKLHTTISVIILITFGIGQAVANESVFLQESFGLHPKAGILFTGYNADFQNFEGSVDCGLFENGSGFGLTAGLFLEKYIGNDFFLGTGVSFVDRSGKLSIENVFPSRDLNTNQVVNVRTENFIETNLSFIEFQPEFRWKALDKLINGPLRTLIALRLYIPINKSFTQKEKIISPDNAVFVNAGDIRTQQRDLAEGDITTIKNLGFGLTIGVENMLKISESNFLTQQLSLDYNFGNVTNDANWSIWSVKFEIGLRFSIAPAVEPEIEYIPIEEEEQKKEPIIVEKPKMPKIELEVESLDNFRLKVGEELLATIPVVNAVFFDLNSSEIPAKYSRNTLFDKNFFKGDPVQNHYLIIPKIAYILSQNPQATILIESSTAGSEIEPAGIELARKRAESVKEAFVALGVPETKIRTQPRITPRFQSNQDYPEGILENQRADIILQNAPLQEFVDIRTYTELNGNLTVNVNYENLDPRDIVSIHNDAADTIFNINRTGQFNIPIVKRLDAPTPELLSMNTSARAGKASATKTNEIEINKLPIDRQELYLDNFEAVLRFNYNSNELTDENKALLKQLAEKLPAGATIYIIGSTDILGTTEYNTALARERAQSTERFIRSISADKFNITTSIAVTDKFSDETPQGRFLNRNIKIRVKR